MHYLNYGALLDELRSFGLIIDSIKIGHGIQRCKARNCKPGDVPGWYAPLEHRDGHLTCWYGDWRQSGCNVWRSYGAKERTPERKKAENRWLKELKPALDQETAANQEKRAKAAEDIKDTLNGCRLIEKGTPGYKYLLGRYCLVCMDGSILPTPETGYDLLEHPSLLYWDRETRTKSYHPAMIGILRNPQGKIVALHRTYLTHDGRKADVPAPKKITPACGSLDGAAIRLGFPKQNTEGAFFLGAAEGIETALSAGLFKGGLPVWAAYCSEGLKKFEPPRDLDQIEEISIFADNDKNQKGQHDAKACYQRLALQGFSVKYYEPTEPGTDFNDVWVTLRKKMDGVN